MKKWSTKLLTTVLMLFLLIPSTVVFAGHQDATGYGTAISGGARSITSSEGAFDNNNVTWWQSSQSNTFVSGNAWIGYDFGSGIQKEITRIKYLGTGLADSITNVKIEFSDNGTSWTTALNYQLAVTSNIQDINVPASGRHQFWRISAASNPQGNYYWSVHELSFMENIAPPKPDGLNANVTEDQVTLTWNAVDDDDLVGYNVYQNGVKLTQTLTTQLSQVISSLAAGTYSFELSALDSYGVESPRAMITVIIQGSEHAILSITFINGTEREYDLSADETNAFIEWYDAKDAGSGPAKYAFAKTWNKGPFKTRTEYVIFDKILTFDVDEYEVENP